MPVDVRRLPDEPILMATLSGFVDVSMIEEMFRESADLISEREDCVFRLTDVRQAVSNFADIMAAIQIASKGQPGSTTDPRIHAIFLGNNHWVAMVRSALRLKQFGGIHMPMFLTEKEALDYIRGELVKLD